MRKGKWSNELSNLNFKKPTEEIAVRMRQVKMTGYGCLLTNFPHLPKISEFKIFDGRDLKIFAFGISDVRDSIQSN